MDTRVRDELGGGGEKKKKKGQSHDVGAILFKNSTPRFKLQFPWNIACKNVKQRRYA